MKAINRVVPINIIPYTNPEDISPNKAISNRALLADTSSKSCRSIITNLFSLCSCKKSRILLSLNTPGADPGLGRGGGTGASDSKGIPANRTGILTIVAVLYKRTGICYICTGIFSWDKITDCSNNI